MNIQGKRIVITGAASGIGAALLKRLSRYPCEILAVDRDAVEPSPYMNGKAQITTLQADISTESGNVLVFDTAQQTIGGIDIYIANAGFAHYGLAQSLDWGGMEAMFKVNVMAPLYVTTQMQQNNPETPYMVVVTASAMAHLALPGYAHYAATKAALHRFAEAYHHELPAHGHLLMVYPIATRTRFFEKHTTADAPRPFPSQSAGFVAGRIINGIKKNRRQVKPSPGFKVYWAFARIIPPARRIYTALSALQLRRWLRKQP